MTTGKVKGIIANLVTVVVDGPGSRGRFRFPAHLTQRQTGDRRG